MMKKESKQRVKAFCKEVGEKENIAEFLERLEKHKLEILINIRGCNCESEGGVIPLSFLSNERNFFENAFFCIQSTCGSFYEDLFTKEELESMSYRLVNQMFPLMTKEEYDAWRKSYFKRLKEYCKRVAKTKDCD